MSEIYYAKEPLPIDFVNTIYAEKGTILDALTGAGSPTAWLLLHRGRFQPPLPAEHLATVDAQREECVRELRDAARRLLTAAAGGEPAHPWDVVLLNRVSGLTHSWPALSWPSDADPQVETVFSTDTVTRAQGELARGVIELIAVQRHLVALCRAPGCVLFFYRHHPRREWCSSGCGNRARVARHYRRHANGRGGDGGEEQRTDPPAKARADRRATTRDGDLAKARF
jgi:predicted RNA-binding Zn ribbon-like protein